ncbi:hypothetical protein [Streptomyces goshikiensis]|uniref:hypothetical protein n=1 Tax=Streptomyces goshikiensis TaxID=1942 RepID=UPI002ADF34C2|nr:hypothetical protein [Streptomyces goshikiensis]
MSATDDLRVAFHDYRRPEAAAGVYTLTAEHRLTKDGTRVDSPAIPATEQRFEIRAVRFVLDPSSVHARYPAEGAVGDFGRTLPHITLNRSILPWERLLKARAVPEQAPWLALLVFRAGELPDDPEGLGLSTTRTVAELRRPPAGTLGPDLSDIGITPAIEASRCQSIDVPAALFTALVPREEELHYLAHVRDVSPRPRRGGQDGEVLAKGQYAVLAANRFPGRPGTYTAHLVSLEGFEGRLEPGRLPAGTNAVRLCALHSWTFTSAPDGTRDPAALLSGLVAPARADRENLALRLRPGGSVASRSAPEAERYTERRLHLGYVPLPYRLLSGETTYGWYRGPFLPVMAAATRDFARDAPQTTADHALIYEPEHGLFDISYAAAWTLGRTLALSDPDYSEEITRARRELANTAATMMAVATEPTLAATAPGDLAGRALRELADSGFAAGLREALARPLAPPDQAPAPAARRTRLTREAGRAVLADAPRAAALRAAAERHTRTMPAWLDELTLLRRVPFNYLVPHPAMLPPESIRLFRIDANWIEALLAGARDVGVHTSLDAFVDRALTADIDRRRARTTASRSAAGLLIRSDLVRTWPEFDLLATAAGRSIGELRRDHPSPDTLLILLNAMPDEIVIREPGQGIHFGLDANGATGDNSVINLRDHRPGTGLGHPLRRDYPAGGGLLTRHLRPPTGDDAPDVLALRGERGLVPALAAALDPGLDDLAPGEFALQLVNAPVEQRLTLDPAPREETAR